MAEFKFNYESYRVEYDESTKIMNIVRGFDEFQDTAYDGEKDNTFESGDIINHANDDPVNYRYIGYHKNGFLALRGGYYSFFSVTNAFPPGDYLISTDPMTVCFQRGTRLLLADGRMETVEALMPGDMMATADGWAEPVLWVGCTTVPRTDGGYMPEHLPIRIRAGALDGRLPIRDLVVSPGHGICFGDVMIPARTLVNGQSIVIDFAETQVQYWHVRLPRHTLLISEGVASESFKHHPKYKSFD